MRINTIKQILNNQLYTCKHCQKQYLPMNEIAASFCVHCQQDEIKEYKETLYFVENLTCDDEFFGVTD